MPTAKRASADAHVHVRVVDDNGLGPGIIWDYAPTSAFLTVRTKAVFWPGNRAPTELKHPEAAPIAGSSALIQRWTSALRAPNAASATRLQLPAEVTPLIDLRGPAPLSPSSRRTRNDRRPDLPCQTYCRYYFPVHIAALACPKHIIAPSFRSLSIRQCPLLFPPSDSNCPPESPDHGLCQRTEHTHRFLLVS